MLRIFFIFLASFFLISLCLAQKKATLYGSPSDSTIIKQKKVLESKGWTVTVQPKRTIEEDKVQRTDNELFIEKYTNSDIPQFELVDLEGKKVNSEDLKGKFVHINFWSTTCKPCIEEFPELNELKKKYEVQGFVFLAIAPESKKKVNKILKRNPLDYRVIAEAADYFDQVGIDGYPKNFFVDQTGKIIKVTDGTRYKGEMKDGEMVMIPDNFGIYDAILSQMN